MDTTPEPRGEYVASGRGDGAAEVLERRRLAAWEAEIRQLEAAEARTARLLPPHIAAAVAPVS